MRLHATGLRRVACAFSERTTAVLRHPVAILLFPPLCAAFLLAGWLIGRAELFLLVLTTVLSVLAATQAQMMLLKQGKADGEVG